MNIRRTIGCAITIFMLAGCVTISPGRRDFAVVEGRVEMRAWNCGTVPRGDGGYFYVCDMPMEVRRVVLGQHRERVVTARFFFLETDRADEIVTGPHWTRDRRAAAILWRRDDGTQGSYVLAPFPGRWCVPDWMASEFAITPSELTRLGRAGYPSCSALE